MKKYYFLPFFFLFAYCTAQRYPVNMQPNDFHLLLNSTIGQDENYIRRNFGPPDNILDNGELGQLFVYQGNDLIMNSSKYSRISSFNNNIYYRSSPSYTMKFEQYVRFWINKSGNVTRWDVKGWNLEEDVNKNLREEAQKKDIYRILGIGLIGVAVYSLFLGYGY